MKRAFAILSIIIFSLSCLCAQVSTSASMQIKGYKNKTTTSTGNFTLSLVSYDSNSVSEGGTIILDTTKHATATSTDTKYFTWNLSRTYDYNTVGSDFGDSASTFTIGTLTFTVGLLKASYNGATYNPGYTLSFEDGDVTAFTSYLRKGNRKGKYYTFTPAIDESTPVNDEVSAEKNKENFTGSVFSFNIKINRARTSSTTSSYDMAVGGSGNIKISSFPDEVANMELTYTAPVLVEFTAN
ncbi:MAG: hypothetical protein ACQGQO_01600 [Sphaerochaetaceae bacterium]